MSVWLWPGWPWLLAIAAGCGLTVLRRRVERREDATGYRRGLAALAELHRGDEWEAKQMTKREKR